MGYSTDFEGSVKIVPELTISSLETLKEALESEENDISWNLELTKNMREICWRGEEKTYGFEESLNSLEKIMQQAGVKFSLEGEFKYQGEEMDDRGFIRKIDGKFQRVEITMQEGECKCPECGKIFMIES